MYDINDYSEEELYKVLNLNKDVNDRELEAKIIFMYRKYKNLQTEAGEKLAKFFNDIHDYFFKQENKEGFENEDSKEDESPTRENNEKNEETQEVVLTKEVESSKGVLNPLIQQTIQRVISIDSQYREDKKKLATDFTFNLSEPLKDVVSLSLYSVQIPYTWYTVNSNFGSNFFFLKGDAPGINNGNFDYKIEITPGNYTAENLVTAINDAFQLETLNTPDVNFGNTNISYNVNNQITTLKLFIEQNFTETSYYFDFMTWSQSSNPLRRRDETIASFLGFQEQIYYFDELTSYRGGLGGLGILGQNADRVAEYWVDETSKKFEIIRYYGPDEYVEGVSREDIKITIELNINWNAGENGTSVSRNTLETELNNALRSSDKLTFSSQLTRKTTNINELGYNEIVPELSKTYYSLKIEFDRATTTNDLQLKTYIKFPSENNIPVGKKKVWTGGTSGFRFKEEGNELNELISEYKTTSLSTNRYKVLRNPYIRLICIKDLFDIEENNFRLTLENSWNEENVYRFTDVSGGNNYVTDVSSSFIMNADNIKEIVYNKDSDGDYIDTNGNKIYRAESLYSDFKSIEGYTLANYLNTLNIELNLANEQTKNDRNLEGDIVMTNSRFYLTENSEVSLDIDIKKIFERYNFYIDIGVTSILKYLFNYETNAMYDLSDNVFESISNINATYTFLKNDSRGHLLFTVYPKADTAIRNMPKIDVVITFPGEYYVVTTIEELAEVINNAISSTLDYENDGETLSGTSINIYQINNQEIKSEITVNIRKILTENDYKLIAYDPGYEFELTSELTSWEEDLYFKKEVLNPITQGVNINNEGNEYTTIILGTPILLKVIIVTSLNNKFKLIAYKNGVIDNSSSINDIEYEIPAGEYNRDQLIVVLDNAIKSNEMTKNSKIELYEREDAIGALQRYTKIRIELQKQYTATDYKVVFYDPFSFAACYTGVQSVRTATFDNTLGWTLGFREYTTYFLRSYTPVNGEYTLTGSTTVSTDLYNYLLITLDDFNQNHLNDGLVTISNKDTEIRNPIYAEKSKYKCDPATKEIIYETSRNEAGNNLTQAQLYTITEIANSRVNTIGESSENYGSGPFVKDVFGLIPIKTAALQNGNVYVEFGGTLQNQQRTYFGPVNISRMAVRLLSDKGDVMNLNGSNWSFSLIAEQLYQS